MAEQELLPVTQDDRETAALFMDWLTSAQKEWEGMPIWFAGDSAKATRQGVWDNHDVVQIIAKRRIASTAALEAQLSTLSSSLREAADALRSLIEACDNGRRFETGAGGMTIDAQIMRTIINGVAAFPVEAAREALSRIEDAKP